MGSVGAGLIYCPGEVGWTLCPLSPSAPQASSGTRPKVLKPWSSAPKAQLSDNGASTDQLENMENVLGGDAEMSGIY